MARTVCHAIVTRDRHRHEESEMDPRVTYWMIATEQGRDRDERARERLSRLVAHPGPERHHRDAGERGIAALVARLTRSLLFRRPDGPGIGTSSPTEA